MSQAVTVEGIVYLVGETKQLSASYKNRELVVETQEQYSQKIKIDFGQEKVDFLNHVKLGQLVKVHVNLKGKEWINPQGESVFFNTISGWRIEILKDVATNSAVDKYMEQAQPAPTEEEHDDLPF